MKEQVDIIGYSEIPSHWWSKWEGRSEYFTETGEPSADRFVPSWEGRFERAIQKARKNEGLAEISPEEKEAIYAMLQPMLVFNPENRCTAAQVVESEWITRWALPECKKIKM
ncbi:hypothetical protein F4819DRAFT_466372 [Hypoxylon fuscum]|nr:hypothetical protein F4819DRAFT_466372 [Hypoxylon fuscum]